MRNPKISVTIISYNHENFISQAIESVINQKTTFPFEILVADDFSKDNTRAILREYKEKHPNLITLFFNEENLGNTRTHLEVCKKAKGIYICNLEGDDYWCDEFKLQKQNDFLDNNPDYIGVAHRLIVHYSEEKSRVNICEKACGKFVLRDFLMQKRFSCTSTLYKNIYLNLDHHYEILYTSDRIVGDYILCLYLLGKGNIYVMKDAMAVYRVGTLNPLNYNNLTMLVEKMESALNLRLVMYEYFSGEFDFSREFIEPLMVLWFFSLKYRQKDLFKNAYDSIPLASKKYFKRYFILNLILYIFKYFRKKLIY